MKTKMILSLCLVVSLLFCACGAPGNQNEEPNANVGVALEETTEAPTTEQTLPEETTEATEETETPVVPETTTPAPTPTTPTPTTAPTEAPVVETKNEFFNDSNNFYEAGNVSIRPRHMYWDGNVLVAQCFVINGLGEPVTNIVVNDLDFSNGSGLIADAQFGALQGLTLQPYSHVLWTFKFGADTVYLSGADLSSISYHSSVSFDH